MKFLWGNYYWPFYLILAGLLFAIPEVIALLTNAANTLTDYTHYQLNVTTASVTKGIHTVAWYASLIGWLTFVVITTWHIWWNGP